METSCCCLCTNADLFVSRQLVFNNVVTAVVTGVERRVVLHFRRGTLGLVSLDSLKKLDKTAVMVPRVHTITTVGEHRVSTSGLIASSQRRRNCSFLYIQKNT